MILILIKKTEENKKLKIALSVSLFVLYSVLTLIGALNHENWFDECQAWTIARDNDIKGIFDVLQCEGHPPLWYMILYVFSHLGFSCNVLSVISWGLCCAAVALMLWKAPFNIFVKAAVIFSGGFLFSISVISRVYAVIPLILALIAILYPKRNCHPVLFGLCVALLANTHISMCGLVGILGIYMIVDLFKNFKTDSVKQRIGKLCGLAVSGVGVIFLVVPLIGSIASNPEVSGVGGSATALSYQLVMGLMDAAASIVRIRNVNALCSLIAAVILIGTLTVLILMRHYTRAVPITLVFLAFHIYISVMLWTVHPTRTYICHYTIIFIYWAVKSEGKEKKCSYKKLEKLNIGLGRKITECAVNLDRRFDKVIAVIFTVIMLFTLPTGFYWLFYDYTKSFTADDAIVRYIKDELPDDAVIVLNDPSCAQLSAYLPDTLFYSPHYAQFITYNPHSIELIDENIDEEKVYNDLKDYKHLYFYQFTNIYYYDDCAEFDNKLIVSSVNSQYYVMNKYSMLKELNLDAYRTP